MIVPDDAGLEPGGRPSQSGPSAVSAAEAAADGDERAVLVGAIAEDYQAYLRHFRCAAADRLARQGVSMAHLHVLWLLLEHGELSMSRLAELLDVSLSNATGLIDRMEERSLVERARVPDDRRLVLVRPTAHGLEAVQEMEAFKRDLFESVLGRLDTDQLNRLRQTIRDLATVVDEAPGGCGPAPTT